MTCRVWTDGSTVGGHESGPANESKPGISNKIEDSLAFGGGKELGRMGRHTEFVMGVDWCLFGGEGWCASCGWDERLFVWDIATVM